MDLTELTAKIAGLGIDPLIVTVSADERRFYEWGYNVVPQGDGTFVVKQTDGRGGWTTEVEDLESRRPRVFPSEDAVSDWLWTAITKAPAPVSEVDLSPKQIKQNLRQIRKSFDA
jgi:hypothetical protein